MEQTAESLYNKLNTDAIRGGYNLNPDLEFTMALVEGLLKNEKRYGYQACPCRLADGVSEADLDIICPCDYRDPDLNEYDTCYCGLYVSQKIVKGEKKLTSIPERRPEESKRKTKTENISEEKKTLAYPVWRCKVCGYLCAREEPPATCPICKVDKDRFERFM
ncbi:MAG TPA: ferredoxin-thioredoxin reductase catalytic domain-containing protein [Spirochaetota bacterium]